jgi:hypothetical protein
VVLEALSMKCHSFDSKDNDGMILAIAKTVGGQAMIYWGNQYKHRLNHRKIDRISRCKKIPFERLIRADRAQFRDRDAINLLETMLVVDRPTNPNNFVLVHYVK